MDEKLIPTIGIINSEIINDDDFWEKTLKVTIGA